MSNQQQSFQQIQAQVQALGNEIQTIRNHLGPAMQESNRLRAEASRYNAAAIANDNHMAGLVQRLQRVESTQKQLLSQLGGGPMPLLSPASGYGASRPPPGTLQAPSYGASAPHGPPRPSDANSPTTPRAGPVHPRTDQQQQQKTTTRGSKNNADFLPMVIENILVGHRHFTQQGTLGICQFVLERQGDRVEKCPRSTFSVDCFREDHFHYCRKHMRVIPGGMAACSHANKADCLAIYWEYRDDWETIVDTAYRAGNLGKKGLDEDKLKEALLPPLYFMSRYT